MFVRGYGWALAALACAMGIAAPARATVRFENSGTMAGWDSQLTQMKGTITEVEQPTFASRTALRMEQTFEGLGGYHSEVRKHDIQKPGEVLFYGEALYLPPEWKFHAQNVTFEQWARSDVFGTPWILMYVEGERLKLGGSGPAHGDLGSVAGMAGKWIRIVTRIEAKPAGAMDVWVNGQNTLSLQGNFVPDGQNLRWSVGMYCTRWRQEQPAGLNPMVLFHDQMRVATTLEEADPASWAGSAPPSRDGGMPLPADADVAHDTGRAEAGPDAGPIDAREAPDVAGPEVEPSRIDARVPSGGGSADEGPEPTPSVPNPTASKAAGCQMAGGDAGWSLLLVLAALAARRRR
jgi:hypothetical protein